MKFINTHVINNDLMMLGTEQRNERSVDIDKVSTEEMLRMINDEDRIVPDKVREVIPQIAQAVELISPRLEEGGRLVYVGAGTSARMAYVDAAECPPTFFVKHDVFNCLMAGGRECVFKAGEGNEDSEEAAVRDLIEFGLNSKDTVVAVAASGRTPYGIAALKYAAKIGAGHVAISCNCPSEFRKYAEVAIEMNTGAEVLMGSTRMKAGTAQKLAMNMLSTALMIKQGRTISNVLIEKSVNSKCDNRMPRNFAEAIGNPDLEYAVQKLKEADGCMRCALIHEFSGCKMSTAKQICDECDGKLKWAIEKGKEAAAKSQ